MHGSLNVKAGRKRKFRGSTLRPPTDRRPDDRLLASLQPHRRWLPEGVQLAERASSMLGCLNLKRLISDEQYDAGSRYAVAVGAYRSVIGGPGGTAGAGKGYDCQPIGCKPVDCECLDRTAKYLTARFALSSAGEDAMRAVENLVLYEQIPDDMTELKRGLSQLQAHYGLTSGRKLAYARNTN